jgi:Cytochrome b involved in lipid metabolism
MKDDRVATLESHTELMYDNDPSKDHPDTTKSKLQNFFASVLCCLWKKELRIYKDYAEIEKEAKKTGKVLIIYKDSVYDVTNFLDEHPGGRELLLLANGKIVDKVWDKYHYPLGKAPKLLKKYKIGEVHPT